MPTDSRLTVLYVAGSGRSGSTLIDAILGQVPGWFAVGEVRNVWDYGLVEQRPCGCGQPVNACEVWSRVVRRLEAGGPLDPAEMAAWREQFAQTKRLLPIMTRGAAYAAQPAMQPYLDTTRALYQAIAAETGARVIVDSSKWPTYAFLLGTMPDIDLYVLHLVRDPRACAFSWRRKKQAEPGRYLDQQSAAFTTAYWAVWNPAIRHLFGSDSSRYRFLRYEDFAASPRSRIAEVLEFLGEPMQSSPFVSDDTAVVHGTHAIEGNAAKFTRGDLVIRADDEWRARMPWGSRAVVTAMTWPWLWQYGYTGRGGSRPA